MTGGVISGPALEIVTKAVYDTLSAAKSLEGVTVLWGPPAGAPPQEFVAIGYGPDGESWDSDSDWADVSRVTVDETFTLSLGVEVLRASGEELRPAFTRSREIAEAVQAALREDPGLSTAEGNAQIRNVRFSKLRGRYFRTDKSRGHRVFLTLTGIARI